MVTTEAYLSILKYIDSIDNHDSDDLLNRRAPNPLLEFFGYRLRFLQNSLTNYIYADLINDRI